MTLKLFPVGSLLLVSLLLSACAETRFGDEVKRDSNGELPPLPVTAITDQEAFTLYIALLDEPLLPPGDPEKANEDGKAGMELWDRAREELKDSSHKALTAQQYRVGRLKHMIADDKTDIRNRVLKFWLIQYKDLAGQEAETAAKVLQDQVFAQTDLSAIIHLAYLSTMVLNDERKATFTDEHRAALARMDKYYRTGDKEALKENSKPVQP